MAGSNLDTSSTNQLPGAFSLLKPSWEGVRLNLITFFELAATPLLFSILASVVNHGKVTGLGEALGALGDIIAVIFAPALVITQLKSVRQEKIDFSDAIKQGLHFLWRYLGLALCMVVVIGIGLILFIVPGLFMLRRYFLAPFYLIDRDMKVFDAMRASAADSKQFSAAVWGLIGVEILFALLSIVLVGIVLVVMYYCASAIRYTEIKKLTTRKKA